MNTLSWTFHDYQGDSGFGALLNVLVNGDFASVATTSGFAFVNGDETILFEGQFTVDGFGKLTGGTITGFHVYEGDDLLLDAAGHQLSVADFTAGLAAAEAGDIEVFFATILNARLEANGSDSTDFLVGSQFADILHGMGSTDVISGRDGNDAIFGGNGGDSLAGGAGRDRMKGDSGNDLIAGDDGKDRLYGGDGHDRISGGNSRDLVNGGDGDDILVGGRGNDSLNGGRGDDTFFFDDSPGAVGVDTFEDFSAGHDQIGLLRSAFDHVGNLGQLGVGRFHIGSHAHDKNDRVIYDDETGALFYDTDGKGGEAQVKIAMLAPELNLSNASFFVSDGSELFAF